MAQLPQQFNSEDVTPSEGFDPIPAGWYPAVLTSSDQKSTKNNDGWYANCIYDIVGDQYANRKIFDILNLGNASPKAMEIAYRNLSAICHATGKLSIASTEELHNIPMMVMVKVEPAVMEPDRKTVKYEAKNSIKGWKPMEGGGQAPTPNAGNMQQPSQQFTGAPTPPVATPSTTKAPWDK